MLYVINYIKLGWAPFHYAAFNNMKNCIELLLSHGADVNIMNDVSDSMIDASKN